MVYYLHNVELPFSKKQLRYKEISSSDQLHLAKANVLLPNTPEFIGEYAILLSEIVSNCLKEKTELYELNIIEYIMLLTKMRIVSIGSELELELEPEGSEKEIAKKVKITLNLNDFLVSLYEISSFALGDNIVTIDNFEIELDWPSIKSQNYFLNLIKESKSLNNILDSLCEYIKQIKISDHLISFSNFTHEEKIKIYEKLPIIVQNKLQVHILKMIKDISEPSLFKLPKLDQWKFNLYDTGYLEILRLFFSFNLRNIYQEYYILASKKIDPEFVNNLTISERKIFLSFVEEEIKANKEANEQTQPPSFAPPEFPGSPDVQNLIREFEG